MRSNFRVSLKIIIGGLAILGLYCFFTQQLIWTGVSMMIMGILIAVLFKTTVSSLIIFLAGLMSISLKTNKDYLTITLAALMLIIILINGRYLIRILTVREYRNIRNREEFFNKTRKEEPLYKIWTKFRKKGKSE